RRHRRLPACCRAAPRGGAARRPDAREWTAGVRLLPAPTRHRHRPCPRALRAHARGGPDLRHHLVRRQQHLPEIRPPANTAITRWTKACVRSRTSSRSPRSPYRVVGAYSSVEAVPAGAPLFEACSAIFLIAIRRVSLL